VTPSTTNSKGNDASKGGVPFKLKGKKRQYHVLLCATTHLRKVRFTQESDHSAPSRQAAAVMAFHALDKKMNGNFTLNDIKTWVMREDGAAERSRIDELGGDQ
jgi:hypothetical protein